MSVAMVSSLVWSPASARSVSSSAVMPSVAAWSSWSSRVLVCATSVVWVVSVPERVPVVWARVLSPLPSWGRAPSVMVLRAAPVLSMVVWTAPLRLVASALTDSMVLAVSVLRVWASLRVCAVLSFWCWSLATAFWTAWVRALSGSWPAMALSRSMMVALAALTFCRVVTASPTAPLATVSPPAIWWTPSVVCCALWLRRLEPVSRAPEVPETNVLRPFWVLVRMVETLPSPLPASVARRCRSATVWRAVWVWLGTSLSLAVRSAMVARVEATSWAAPSSASTVVVWMLPAVASMWSVALLTASVRTSLTVETKVELTWLSV